MQAVSHGDVALVRRIASLLSICMLTCAVGAARAQQKRPPLPLQRVRFYDTGVAYFERSGRIPGGDGLSLPVPAGHLDDALKTLVVLSKDGKVRVDGI